jgi:AraC family transcriptional regulator
MNYRENMERIICYIEFHLDQELTVTELTQQAGYSLYHFCRVFQAYQGVTVMDYVRSRRLALAAQAIVHGKDGISTALEHGFDTQSGFSRAFKRAYGISPTQYKYKNITQGGKNMNVQIIQMPAFKVAGYGVDTNIAGSYTQDIAAFWEKCDSCWEGKLYNQLNPPKHGEVCLCLPESRHSSNLVYVMGVIVEDFSLVSKDMVAVTVPAATYAVFTTPPIFQVGGVNEDLFAQGIHDTWRDIYDIWFEDSGYAYNEDGLDFEFYDERCHHTPNSVMDIYIPIMMK